jgi:transposase
MMAFSYGLILSLDLGKFNSVCCVYDPVTHDHRFITIRTDPQSIHDLLFAHQGEDPAKVLVVFETCELAGWVHDIAAALGFAIAVANPCNEAWRWTKVKRKTDKDDALKCARLALLGQLPVVYMPSPVQRQKRRLVHYRKTLVWRMTQVKNQIRSILSQQGLTIPSQQRAWTIQGKRELSELTRPIHTCSLDDLWRGRLHCELQLLAALDEQLKTIDQSLGRIGRGDERIKLLQTVPGVGERLAETVVAYVDDATRFKSAAHISSYAGLVPKQLESGTMKRVGRITRRGPSLLRGMLVEVAWQVYRFNGWGRWFVEKISKGQKDRRKIAIVALARKLLVILWAMLKHHTPWKEPAMA